jgi:preprotein translocase subunit SecG
MVVMVVVVMVVVVMVVVVVVVVVQSSNGRVLTRQHQTQGRRVHRHSYLLGKIVKKNLWYIMCSFTCTCNNCLVLN